MEMDVAWCLTCSKQTRDPRSPYCSNACRQAENQPSSSSTTPIPVTSPVTPIRTSPRIATVKSKSSVKKHAKRPSMTPLAPLPPASEIGSLTSSSHSLTRDRRGFPFPAMQSLPPQPVMTKERKAQEGSNVLPTFARKPSLTAAPLNSPVLTSDALSLTRPLGLGSGSAKTTGAKTPLFSDSVFCSTSESCEKEPGTPPIKPLTPILRPPRASNSTTTIHASTLPDNHPFSILRSQVSSAWSCAHPRPRETSHSPAAAMVASSAGSRSREDIISWAKGICMRPNASRSNNVDRPHGRSRTRSGTLAHLPPPITELRDEREEHESTGRGTTPKVRIGSAVDGPIMSGIAPIVKALTSVTSTTIPPDPNASSPSTPGLGLHSVPAPPEISRVTVVATTSTGEGWHDPPPAPFFGCATPTLSASSFSEVIDPSAGDNYDPVDIFIDDQSTAESAVARRLSMPFKPRQPSSSSSVPPPVRLKERSQRNSLPLPPIATIATAISNHSPYLRTFGPLSIASVITAHVPFAAVDPLDPALDSFTTALVRSPSQPNAPKSVLRGEPSTQEPAPLVEDLACSLPMDIFPPHNGVEGRRSPSFSYLRNTQSPSPTRDRTTSRSRSRSRVRVARTRSSSAGIQVAPVNRHVRKWSYDAAQGDDGEPRRGRSRVSKALGSPKNRSVSALQDE